MSLLSQSAYNTSKIPSLSQKYHIFLISTQKMHTLLKKNTLIPLNISFKTTLQSHYTKINLTSNSKSCNKTLLLTLFHPHYQMFSNTKKYSLN